MINHLVPTEFYLGQNYPNPFKDKTVIKYCVAYKTRVRITVYDAEGNEIEKLVDEEKEPGTHQVEFSICHSRESAVGGGNLPAGRYGLPDGYCYYKMTAGDYISEKKWLCINNLLRSNTMKTLLRTLFFFLLVTQIGFGQWVQIGLDDEAIKEIASRNSNIFAVTTDSAVYRSTNNGIYWSQIVDSGAIDIAVSPQGTLFMVSKDSLYNSSDNGYSWINLNIMVQLPSPYTIAYPTNVTVSPLGIVFCGIKKASKQGNIIVPAFSTDNGFTWSSPGDSIYGGHLFDFRGQCIITYGERFSTMGGHSYMYLSSDNGQTWLHLGSPPNFDNNVLSMCLNGNILIGGLGLYLSIDTCSSWIQVSWLNPKAGLSIESGGILIGTDSHGVFLFSDNGDSLGSFNDGLDNLNVQSLAIDNNDYVYAGNNNGLWRRPLSEIVTSTEEITPTFPTEYLLSQNYPNPFNNSCAIKYSIPKSSQVTLKIFNTLGEELETLVNSEKSVGAYELNWNAANLPSGVYFYQLKAGDYMSVKKMILLK